MALSSLSLVGSESFDFPREIWDHEQDLGGLQSSTQWGKKLLAQYSEGDSSLALFLLEGAAIHARDTDGLEMAIALLEMFYA